MEHPGTHPTAAAQPAQPVAAYYAPPGSAPLAAGAYPAPAAQPAAADPAAAGSTSPLGPTSGSKRSYEAAGGAADGVAEAVKRQQLEHSAAPVVAAARLSGAAAVPRETVYRLVMDVVDTALIIGRGGNTVRQIEAATNGRVKRLQEPPGAREQVVVVWSSARDTPSPGRTARNTAQEALLECVRRVVFQETAPMGQPSTVRVLVNRTQEQGVVDNMAAIVSENPGTSIAFKHHLSLPPCALDNDVLIELTGERYSLMAAVETLSHVLREHPALERPGTAPPALRAMAVATGPAGGAAPSPAAPAMQPAYVAGGYAAPPVAAAAPAGYRAY
ncbi:hypothetical protein ABPG75_011507 [Micractinium tetrahymenae]